MPELHHRTNQDLIVSFVANPVNGDLSVIYKYPGPHELGKHGVVLTHADELLDGDPAVIIPLIDPFQTTGMLQMEYLEPFEQPTHRWMSFYAGKEFGDREADMLIRAVDLLRRTIPAEALVVVDPTLMDGNTDDIDNVLRLLDDCPPHLQEAIGLDRDYLISLLMRTTEETKDLPLLPSHMDATARNFSANPAENEVYVIDFDTMGLAPIGYDEGRLFVSFALRDEWQEAILAAFRRLHGDDEKRALYFWKTVLIRSLRETNLVKMGNGKYSRLTSLQRNILLYRLKQTAYRAIAHCLFDMESNSTPDVEL